jgi:hypothetical protein
MNADDGQVPVNLVQKRRCQLIPRGYHTRVRSAGWRRDIEIDKSLYADDSTGYQGSDEGAQELHHGGWTEWVLGGSGHSDQAVEESHVLEQV